MPKRNDFSSRSIAILWSVSQLIVIVSSDTKPKKHFGSFVTLILHKKVLVAKFEG